MKTGEARKASERVYSMLKNRGIEVLFDDRDLRAGEKFKDSDLIGIPLRLIVSKKTLVQGVCEIKERMGGEISKMEENRLTGFIEEYLK